MSRRCIVVFRANDVCHLGVVRSLAALHVDVVSVVWDWPGAPVFYSDRSRHLGRARRIANPGREPQAALEDIRHLLSELGSEYGMPPLLMPTSDSILNFLLSSPSLWPLGQLANAWNFETTAHLLDKFNLSQRLRETRIRQPETRRCTSDVVRDMRLPFVVKPALKDPVNSFYAEFAGAKALFVRSEEQRQALASSDLFHRYPLIAQEYINPQQRVDDMPVYLSTDDQGRILHCTSVDKVFVHPAGFGTAYIVRDQSDSMVDSGALQDFVSCTGLRGIVMLEFIRSVADDFRFIEANPRPWLLVDYQRLRGRNYFHFLDPALPTSLPEQIDASAHYVELTGLCRAFEQAGGSLDASAVTGLLDSLQSDKRLSTFDPDDPEPMTMELGRLRARYGDLAMDSVEAALGS